MPSSPSCARARYRGFPVGRGSIDKLLGVARKEDVLALLPAGRAFELDKVLSEPVAVPASATILDALELFKRAPIELAIVVDEYGGFEGVVTRTDLLEAIAGDLPEQAGEEPEVKQLPDGALSIDGALPLPDLQERLRLDALPEGSYQTAAGLVLAILGRLPNRGDAVEWGGWKLEVAAMDGLERQAARRPAHEAARRRLSKGRSRATFGMRSRAVEAPRRGSEAGFACAEPRVLRRSGHRMPDQQGHFHSRTSGRSSPCSTMCCLCSISLSRIAWRA